MYSKPFTVALNHLLMQNTWAFERLARFSGKTVRFDIVPFTIACTILPDGTLRSAESAAVSDARCFISPSLLPRLALHDEKVHAEIRSEGDASLLAEIFFLSRNLRWDAAEDLSQVVGDIAAERFIQSLQSAHHQLRDSALNLSLAAAEYLTEERSLLTKPQLVSAFIQHVDTLRDDVARLEWRISQLSTAPAPRK